MPRVLAVILLITATVSFAAELKAEELAAPAGWGAETITLPPRFARDMKLKGTEHVRFAPGMMKPDSDSFFCYAFVFELQPQPVLTQAVLKEEFLKYYRGLCKAVLRGKRPDVDPSTFTLDLDSVKPHAPPSSRDERNEKLPNGSNDTRYTGTLDWVEPFATKKRQSLNLQIRTWAKSDRTYIFVCASPQPRDGAIWKVLHAIRDDYFHRVPPEN